MANEHQADVNLNVNGEEAEEQLRDLIKVTQKWKEELVKAYRANDPKLIKETTKNLKAAEKQTRDLEKQLFDVDKVLRNLGGSSLKDLRKAQQLLNRELSSGAVKRNSKEWKELTGKLQKVKGEIRGVQKEMRGASQSTSLWSKGLANIKMLLPALGITAGFAAFVSIVKSAINVTKEFEKSLSSLSAITGLVGDDLDFFKKKAIEFSSVTLKSANDIVKAFELVGSIRPELLQDKEALAEVTKQAIILSEATGGKLGLEEAAKSTAGALNQFSLQSDQAGRVVNALAAGSKVGAAAVVDITSAIEKFGAVADQANIPVEQSIGLIETLAEKQIVGAEAGTKLRNILIILQGDQQNYVDGVFDLNLALSNLSDANLDVTELTKEFGKENVVAAQVLVNSKDKVISYTEAVTGTNTALEQQSIQNDNLAGTISRLSNTWDAFMLKINNSNGWLADNLRFINASIGAINKSMDEVENEQELFDVDGIIRDSVIVTKSVEEIDKVMTSLQTDAKMYFGNWQRASGEERAYWATQYDIAKQNISIIEAATLEKSNEVKVTEKVNEANEKVVTSITTLKEELKNLKAVRETLNVADQAALDLNATQIARLDDFIKKLAEVPALLEEFKLNNIGVEEMILSDEDALAVSEKMAILTASVQYFKELFGDPEAEADMGGIISTYLFGQDWGTMDIAGKIAAVGDLAVSTLGDINKIISNTENQQLMNFSNNVSKRKELLNAQLNDGKISYEEYTARTAQLDEELDKKQRKIAHDQAVRNKAMAVMSAIINTAVGVTAALTMMPFTPANYVLAAISAVLGGIQVGIAASQPVPQYAAGRYPVMGASDGQMYSANYIGQPQTGIVNGPSLISEQGDEMIVDGPTTQRLTYQYPEIIEGIIGMSRGYAPQFADGRYPEGSNTTTTKTFTDPMLISLLTKLDERLTQPLRAYSVQDEDEIRVRQNADSKYNQFQNKVN